MKSKRSTTSSSSSTVSGLVLCFWIIVLFMVNESCLVESSRVVKVGDEFGWKPPTANETAFYSHWPTRNRFHIGDSLLFNYHNDSVMEVDKWGYYHCNGTDPIMAFDNGNSTVKLDRPGPFYFISGAPGHCKNGQRLIVEVMHIHHHPIPHDSPPVFASPPDQYSSIAPSPLSSSVASFQVSAAYVWVSVLASVIAPLLWSEP